MIVTCGCGERLRVSDEAAGQRVKCPGCGELLPVGEEAPADGQIAEAPPARAAREEAPARRPMRPPDEDDVGEEPAFPPAVRAAGIIWVVAGALILLSLGANVLMSLGSSGAAPAEGAYFAGQVCGGLFVAVFGAAFIFVGVQTAAGAARDTTGNAVGSILLGLLNWAGAALNGAEGRFVTAGLAFVCGAALLVAAVLALAGRGAYKEWRRWKAWRDQGAPRRYER
jgi:hypothetical protein